MQNNTFFGHSYPRNIIVLEQISSTNDYSKKLLSKFKPQINFTAIMAKDQTAGRGQRGAIWSSNPNSNVTASFIYTPQKLTINEQFILTIHSSLAVYKVIQRFTQKKISIKWPNDIYINNKKVAGILIENKISGHHIKNVIIGIGINVYQKHFEEEISHKTTSLTIENEQVNLSILEIVKQIQDSLHDEFKRMETLPANKILEEYNDKLFRRNTSSAFMIHDQQKRGIIKEVTSDGLLHVLIDGEINKFDLKDISYII